MERGVYVVVDETVSRGSLVLLSVPIGVRELMGGRGWLSRVDKLLKEVVGVAGDRFCFGGGWLEIGGKRYLVLQFDSEGMELPQRSGCSVVRKGEVFLLGRSDDSFDSRYFGAVRFEEIDKVVRPVFVL